MAFHRILEDKQEKGEMEKDVETARSLRDRGTAVPGAETKN